MANTTDMNSDSRHWPNRIAAGLFLGLSVIAFLACTIPRFSDIVLDDAYMFIRYAKHAIAGHGFCWNTGDGPAFGCTSTLHLLLVTLLRDLTSAPDRWFLAAISYTPGLAACAVLGFAGFAILPRESEDRRHWLPLLAVPPLLLSDAFGFHCLTGMETTLSLFLNAIFGLTAVQLARRPDALRMTTCIIAGYLTFLVRPDNGLYALALPPLLVVAEDRRHSQKALLYGAVLGALFVVDAAAKKALFGSFVPLPFFAKQAGFLRGYVSAANWNQAAMLIEFATAALPFGMIIALTANRRSLPALLAFLAPLTGTFLYFSTTVQIMGYHARFYYPSLAFVVMATVVSVAHRNRDRATGDPHLGVRLACILAMTIPLSSAQFRETACTAWRTYLAPNQPRFQASTQYIAEALSPLPTLNYKKAILAIESLVSRAPKGTTITGSEYGHLGAKFPDTPILDLVGLHDPTVMREGFSAGRILTRRPDILWFPTPDYTHIVAAILDNPIFRAEYDFYPGAFDFGVAVWRRSPRYTGIRDAFLTVFDETYPGDRLEARLANERK